MDLYKAELLKNNETLHVSGKFFTAYCLDSLASLLIAIKLVLSKR